MRQPWNVFVYLYRIKKGKPEYLLLKRRDDGVWQGVAGGGEEGETSEEAAKREMLEETGARADGPLIRLDTMSYMEKYIFQDSEKWEGIYVIPMYYFYYEYQGDIQISHEHSDCGWYHYEDAMEKLYWHDNKTALWELNERVKNR